MPLVRRPARTTRKYARSSLLKSRIGEHSRIVLGRSSDIGLLPSSGLQQPAFEVNGIVKAKNRRHESGGHVVERYEPAKMRAERVFTRDTDLARVKSTNGIVC